VGVVEGVLRSGKALIQQFARAVIDINEQDVLRTGVLKPQVMRAIDLNHFAEAITPTARLMQLPSTFAS
jgi:hypothetical protein